MSKYAKLEGLVEMVVELREAGTKWDAEGGIVDQVRDAYPTYTTKSAIPLRKLYHEAVGTKLAKTSKAITAARDAGQGWSQISVRAGLSVSAAKKLYNGEHPDGRIYVDQDGKISTVKTDWTKDDAEVTEVTEDATSASEEVVEAA